MLINIFAHQLQIITMQKMPKYLIDYSCILPPCEGKGGLFIGNLQAAQDLTLMKSHNIKAILSAARGIEIKHPKQQVPYYLHIPAEDAQNFDISRFFHQSTNFIRDTLQRTNVLVHCLAGVSRSATLVIAYLIKQRQLSLQQAYKIVKQKRRTIHPNEGFVSQLRKYEQQEKTKRVSQKMIAQQSIKTIPLEELKNLTQRVEKKQEKSHHIIPTINPQELTSRQAQNEKQPQQSVKHNRNRIPGQIKRFKPALEKSENLQRKQKVTNKIEQDFIQGLIDIQKRVPALYRNPNIQRKIQQIQQKYSYKVSSNGNKKQRDQITTQVTLKQRGNYIQPYKNLMPNDQYFNQR